MSIPAYSDLAKAANDLLNKDFYHMHASAIEIKSTASNGVAFKVNGKSSHEGKTAAAVRIRADAFDVQRSDTAKARGKIQR